MLPHSETLATIVVCEDDEPTLELLCDHLRADRYEALPAPEASGALRHCRYKHPHLLLLDLMLPDAAGLDVLREIRRAHGAWAGVEGSALLGRRSRPQLSALGSPRHLQVDQRSLYSSFLLLPSLV